METRTIPFLINKDGSQPQLDLELAVALSVIKEGPSSNTLPFLRGAEDKPELAAKVHWPFLVQRSTTGETYALLDAVGLLGEGVDFVINPEALPTSVADDLDRDFSQGALELAKSYAQSDPFQYNFTCLFGLDGIGGTLQTELAHPGGGDPFGASLSAIKLEKAQAEAHLLDTWHGNLRRDAAQLDIIIDRLNEIVEQRVVTFEEEKKHALRPLQEQLQQLKPKLEEAVAALHKEESLVLDGLKDQLQVQVEPWESYLVSAQAGAKEFLGQINQLADYYQRQVRLAQDQIKALTSQHSRLCTEVASEFTVKVKAVRRPQLALEQQVAMASRNWEMAVTREKELANAVADLLQQAATSRRMTADELEGWQFGLGGSTFTEMIVAVPFYVARYEGKTPRYLVVPPGRLQAKGQLSTLLTGMVGGTVLPFISRADGWDILAQRLEEILRNDLVPLAITEEMQKANLVGSENWQRAIAGLQRLVDIGMIKPKQAETLKAKLELTS